MISSAPRSTPFSLSLAHIAPFFPSLSLTRSLRKCLLAKQSWPGQLCSVLCCLPLAPWPQLSAGAITCSYVNATHKTHINIYIYGVIYPVAMHTGVINKDFEPLTRHQKAKSKNCNRALHCDFWFIGTHTILINTHSTLGKEILDCLTLLVSRTLCLN